MLLLEFASDILYHKTVHVSTTDEVLDGFDFRAAESLFLAISVTKRLKINVLLMQERIERFAVTVQANNQSLESKHLNVDDVTKSSQVHRKHDTGRVVKVVAIRRKCHVKIEPNIEIPKTKRLQTTTAVVVIGKRISRRLWLNIFLLVCEYYYCL
jgi:hypothetical protein